MYKYNIQFGPCSDWFHCSISDWFLQNIPVMLLNGFHSLDNRSPRTNQQNLTIIYSIKKLENYFFSKNYKLKRSNHCRLWKSQAWLFLCKKAAGFVISLCQSIEKMLTKIIIFPCQLSLSIDPFYGLNMRPLNNTTLISFPFYLEKYLHSLKQSRVFMMSWPVWKYCQYSVNRLTLLFMKIYR